MDKPKLEYVDIPEPRYDEIETRPKTLTKSRRIDDIMYVAGSCRNDVDNGVMIVSLAVEEDEVDSEAVEAHGFRFKQGPRHLKGAGSMLVEIAARAGLNLDDCYLTAICKWLIPKSIRNKPPKKALNWGMPVLLDEIKRRKPKIIVCMGKVTFDMLSSVKRKFSTVHGAWTFEESLGAYLYVMNPLTKLVGNPAVYDTFRVDFQEIDRKRRELAGEKTEETLSYEVLQNENDLQAWVDRMIEEKRTLFAVDCEWHRRTFADGNLRTFQLAWSDTEAVVIRFRNEHNEFDFELTDPPEDEYDRYREIGAILHPLLHQPEVRYIGHHISADWPWMNYWLGIEVFGRCVMDTEFSQQLIDEASELSLERGIAMKYTTLGLYNVELNEWKRNNRKLCEDGYGFIPDSILIPYACLAWDSMVQLGDGRWERIHKLVQEKYTGTVMALVDGVVKPCMVTGWKKTKKAGQRWFRIVTPTTRGAGPGGGRSKRDSGERAYTGPRFTEDHEVVTERGMVRVDRLMAGVDKIATADRKLTTEQRQIILGSMLGDGGLSQPHQAGVRFRFSQYGTRVNYAMWKAKSLSSALTFNRYNVDATQRHSAGVAFEARNHAEIASLARMFSRSGSRRGHYEITDQILEEMGDLGLAVWFMDDGLRQGQHARIIRSSASPAEIQAGLRYFTRRFGRGVKWYQSNGAFVFERGAFYRFMDTIKPFMHPSVAYKHVEGEDIVAEYEVAQPDVGVFYEVIEKVIPADRAGGNKKMECFRYCLTVPEAGNFLTRVGFVSNCRDVIAPFRAYPHIMRMVDDQGLREYHDQIMIPFVADVFTTFTMTGLPLDVGMLEELRVLFQFTKRHLEQKFALEMRERGRTVILQRLLQSTTPGVNPGTWAAALLDDSDVTAHLTKMKEIQALDPDTPWIDIVTHYRDAPFFNIRSPDQMRRWLFTVEGLDPVKTTNQKAKGRPSMAWENVLDLPEEQQKLYTPAVDKQTLQILAEKLPLLEHLLDLNFVGNICKGFLKEPEYYIDDYGDEQKEEQGVLQWAVNPKRLDNNYTRVCAMWSLTETGRPRGWAPNCLNWPSFVQPRIARSVMQSVREAHESNMLPKELDRWVSITDTKEIPSIRSCIKAPPGYVLVEHDYDTAELLALARIAGDTKMGRIFDEKDPAWVLLKPGRAAEVTRITFDDPTTTNIDPTLSNPDFIMASWVNGKKIAQFTEDDLLRDGEGNLVHAKYDMHWMVVEHTYRKPREMMKKKPHRDSGKVLNFCIAGGSLVLVLNTETAACGCCAIQDLDPKVHKVWDGYDWVCFAGVVCTGHREVHWYQGLMATDNHEVWVTEGSLVTFGEARRRGLTLARPGDIDCMVPREATPGLLAVLSTSESRPVTAPVYDVIDAGPRSRFVCSGVLVSNSSLYGASPTTLERKIESDTGVKPEPGTGQAGLDAIRARQPRASEFLDEMEKIPVTTGYYRAASGRIRRCVTHGRNAQVSWRIKNSVASALGREMRNFAMQESVASTAARAGIWLLKAYRMLGLKARPMVILYDSVVSLCPLEERFVVSRLHDLLMCELNTWRYVDAHGDRVLRYSSTGEFNYRWSCPPPEDELARLNDPTWYPTPDRLKWALTFPNWEMVKSMSLVSP